MIIAVFIAHAVGVFFLHGWFWHPLSGLGYQWWSGIGSDIGEVTLLAGALAIIKHLNCDAPGCWRYGPHRTADGMHKLCRVHHPDLPSKKLSLDEIVERHRKHKEHHG